MNPTVLQKIERVGIRDRRTDRKSKNKMFAYPNLWNFPLFTTLQKSKEIKSIQKCQTGTNPKIEKNTVGSHVLQWLIRKVLDQPSDNEFS